MGDPCCVRFAFLSPPNVTGGLCFITEVRLDDGVGVWFGRGGAWGFEAKSLSARCDEGAEELLVEKVESLLFGEGTAMFNVDVVE